MCLTVFQDIVFLYFVFDSVFQDQDIFSLFSVWLCVDSDWTTWPMVDNVASLVSLGEVYNRFGGRQLWCRWLYELHGGGLQENNGCRWMGGWRSDSYAAGDCLDPGMPAPHPAQADPGTPHQPRKPLRGRELWDSHYPLPPTTTIGDMFRQTHVVVWNRILRCKIFWIKMFL